MKEVNVMGQYSSMTADVIAMSISKTVSSEISTRKHSFKLDKFKASMPSDKAERDNLIELIITQIKSSISDVDVFLDGDTIRVIEL